MSRSKQIANRVREVFLDGRWIANTNYKEQVENTTWEQSIQKVGNLNTIAALTYHVDYYLAGLNNVFEGGKLEIHDKFSFDLLPIEAEADWRTLVNELLSNAEKFAFHIESMDDKKLDETFIDEKYGTYSRNIEGVIEHAYYHLGQISLIRKMILEDWK